MDGKAQLYKDILDIAMYAINRAKPDYAVKRALERLRFDGDIYLVAVGKAAWQMADAAMKCVPKPICRGIVLTKYGHIRGGNCPAFYAWRRDIPFRIETAWRARRSFSK